MRVQNACGGGGAGPKAMRGVARTPGGMGTVGARPLPGAQGPAGTKNHLLRFQTSRPASWVHLLGVAISHCVLISQHPTQPQPHQKKWEAER